MPVRDLLDNVIQSWNIHLKYEWHLPLAAQIFKKEVKKKLFFCLLSFRLTDKFINSVTFLAAAAAVFITLVVLLLTFFRVLMQIEDNPFFYNSIDILQQVVTVEVPSPVDEIISSFQSLQCDSHLVLPRQYN